MARQRLADTTDLTDEAWQLLKPLLPPDRSGGRPRKYPLREVLNGIQYVLRAGCAWRLMPHDLPHGQTAYQSFRAWRHDGTWLRMHDQLRDEVRTRMGRHRQPSAVMIDAQTVKTTETGGPTAMTAPRSSTAAHAISLLTRRVSSGVCSSTPPICEMPTWLPDGWRAPMRPVSGFSIAGRIWRIGGSGGAPGWSRSAAGLWTSCNVHAAGAGTPAMWSRRPCPSSRSCRGGGWWNERSPGLGAIAA
jgi:transposase